MFSECLMVNFDAGGSKKMVIVKEGSSKQNHNVVVAEAAAIKVGKHCNSCLLISSRSTLCAFLNVMQMCA